MKLLCVSSILSRNFSDTVCVAIPGSRGIDKVLTEGQFISVSHSHSPVAVAGGVGLRVTIAGNVKGDNTAADTAG